jgi:pyruvate dehydrogenase E2 component (dihydrolipoamide acetyltransferase)
MAEIVRMPRLSDTMTEGTVAQWHKKVGDPIAEGDLLAEIETDKATMEFESFQEGVLLHIGVEEGATAGEKGEDVKALLEADAKPAQVAEVEKPVAVEKVSVPAPVEIPVTAPVAAPVQTSNTSGRTVASPLAKRLAQEKGLDIATIAGSGDGGRIIKRDVDTYQAPSVFASVNQEFFTEEPVSQMRKVIARRLAESKFSAPHFYLSISVDMDNAIAARKAINALPDTKVSFNDLVVKACAMALREHPTVNSSWREDVIRRNQHVNIGIAVAVDDGLLVPVVRFTDTKSLTGISGEVKEYAQKAKDKKLQPADWEGSTFTISNLGMFGIDEFTAIINTPDACILAVGGIQQIPVVKDGLVVPGNVMKLNLSCDHRVVDGASGAAFLNTLKTYLQNPVTMLK